MALIKPSWLEKALSWLNWDILAWKIYLGEPIEIAIDWVISRLNDGIELIHKAWAWIDSWWDRLSDWWSTKWSVITDWFKDISNKINIWWYNLTDWWSTKWTLIKDLGQTIKDWALDILKDIQIGLSSLGVKVSNFFTSILPSLTTFKDIYDIIASNNKETLPDFNGWAGVIQDTVKFFQNPVGFLWDKFTDWFFGWED